MHTSQRAVAIISDYAEEGWVSMDLVADMLAANLPAVSTEWQLKLLRPRMVRTFSHLPLAKTTGAAWNADRLFNRFVIYPKYLREQRRRFALFHITDHSYAHLVHTVRSARTVVTCHDLDAFRSLLTPAQDPRPRWFRTMAARTLSGLQAADRIICVSRTVREDLLATGLVDPRRVSVVHNGAHPSCRPDGDPIVDSRMAARTNVGPGDLLLLHVGSTVPRKRLDVLLRVFAAVRRQHTNATLVRVGGPLSVEQRALAEQLGVLGSIREMPFLEREELAAIYRRANALLLTSEAEGFGLPLVEAMACGCPVIASDLAVAREVCGAAADYCPVADVAAWTATVHRVLTEASGAPEIQIRRRRASLAAASHFTWRENARQVAAIYNQLLNESTSPYERN